MVVKLTSDFHSTYRPRKYGDFAQGTEGQPIATLVQQELARRYPNSTVCLGDFGVGKTSSADVRMARRNCDNWEMHPYEPCGTCDGCRIAFAGGNGMGESVVKFDAAQAGWRIDLEKYFTATRGTKHWRGDRRLPRVVVIDEFWRASEKEQASLLTPIEWGEYSFVLCSSQADRIDGGILSRSTVLRFRLPTESECVAWLTRIVRDQKIETEPGVEKQLAKSYSRRPREILTALQTLTLANATVTVKRVQDLADSEIA